MIFHDINPENAYRILAPRPTVIVTTVSSEGEVNAAPFSFTMPVSMNPPLIAFASVATHHTYQNLEETGEFVVNIPHQELLDKLWITSQKFPKKVNELEKADLNAIESITVKPPGIKECLAHLECEVDFLRECGDHQLVIGKVGRVRIQSHILKDGLLDVEKVKPLLHLGGVYFVIGDHLIQLEQNEEE